MTQDKALDILKTTNDNVFLTGAPGTGKSYLINTSPGAFIQAVEEVFQEVMSDVGKYYRVSDSLSDILSDSLGERLTKALQAQRDAGAREAVVEMTRFAAISRYDGERYYSVSESTIKALTPLPDKE